MFSTTSQRLADESRGAGPLCAGPGRAGPGLFLSGMVVASHTLRLAYCVHKPAGNDSAVESPALVTTTCEN